MALPFEPQHYRDLTNWDALFAAMFGIAISEAAAAQAFVSGAGQIGTGMLATGLFASVRLCWPMSRRPWFWPLVLFFAAMNAALVASVHWTKEWIPALALSPLAFVQGWLFVASTAAIARK